MLCLVRFAVRMNGLVGRQRRVFRPNDVCFEGIEDRFHDRVQQHGVLQAFGETAYFEIPEFFSVVLAGFQRVVVVHVQDPAFAVDAPGVFDVEFLFARGYLLQGFCPGVDDGGREFVLFREIGSRVKIDLLSVQVGGEEVERDVPGCFDFVAVVGVLDFGLQEIGEPLLKIGVEEKSLRNAFFQGVFSDPGFLHPRDGFVEF
mmetsp:Transcript_4252/g.6677  ORF Transcript_4252/g.6677 Transcript_4252/m.6677 type:complete len:202 (-) Transcript_4252:2215-2820(-)